MWRYFLPLLFPAKFLYFIIPPNLSIVLSLASLVCSWPGQELEPGLHERGLKSYSDILGVKRVEKFYHIQWPVTSVWWLVHSVSLLLTSDYRACNNHPPLFRNCPSTSLISWNCDFQISVQNCAFPDVLEPRVLDQMVLSGNRYCPTLPHPLAKVPSCQTHST